MRQHGHATPRWLGDAFIELEAELEGEHVWHFVLGRSDASDQLVACTTIRGQPHGRTA